MSEFLKSLTNEQWFITIVSFLTANGAAIFTFIIMLVKEKLKSNRIEQNVQEALAKQGLQLDREYLDKISEMNEKLDCKLNDVLELVYRRLKIDNEEKRAVVEKQTLDIQELIAAATKTIEEEE